ncbi:MAG: tRNA (adenosine(37)-N6)-threonylcarbamoyltransferase complex dimerization subunit type 1 TsaB [Treponema sp.]|jgi:tRNA threonylcarbamoyladenosine biosynthesis protein TsaB|nr:tRNA (adenosine(37)-N6)-threonylcarbamoyltransferase complex dimerization subunit type 1 TsaB [Treponema sp.]
MNLLAIDTATEQFSIAIASQRGTASDTWLFEADAGLRHSELVMDSIDMLTGKAGLRRQDISSVICMGGPGSFTGLRIGFSIAKGLALSLGISFAAIPTLDCMAWPFRSLPGIIVPVIDAKKGAFFCAMYRSGKRLCPDMDWGPAEIAAAIASASLPATIVGPGAAMLHEKLGDTNAVLGKGLRWGNAKTLLAIAQEAGITMPGKVADGPEYIRKSDAELAGSL